MSYKSYQRQLYNTKKYIQTVTHDYLSLYILDKTW